MWKAVRKRLGNFHKLLGLGESREVVSISGSEDRSTVEVGLRGTGALWVGLKCPDDWEALVCHGHGERRWWRHSNNFEYRFKINCALSRWRFGWCGKRLTVEPSWDEKAKGFTLRFVAICLHLLQDMPVASVACFVDEQGTRLWRIFGRHMDEARKSKDLAGVDSVSFDELAIRKGRLYATVFADARKSDILCPPGLGHGLLGAASPTIPGPTVATRGGSSTP